MPEKLPISGWWSIAGQGRNLHGTQPVHTDPPPEACRSHSPSRKAAYSDPIRPPPSPILPPGREQDELRLRCDELEEALEDRSHKISLLQAECGKLRLGATASASRAGGGPGPGEVPQGSADPAQSAKWVGVPSLAASAGASLAEVSQRRPLAAGRLGEMSASRRSNRRLNLPTPTGEGSDQFARFSNVAMTRKLLLAARGFEVENVFIDQLYDDAKVCTRRGEGVEGCRGLCSRVRAPVREEAEACIRFAGTYLRRAEQADISCLPGSVVGH